MPQSISGQLEGDNERQCAMELGTLIMSLISRPVICQGFESRRPPLPHLDLHCLPAT